MTSFGGSIPFSFDHAPRPVKPKITDPDSHIVVHESESSYGTISQLHGQEDVF